MPVTSDPLRLERHTVFATRLARSLVADENAADDLVQEAWLAVLQRPPRDRRAARGYLATTLRRLAGRTRRSEARRGRRERDTARGEALPSSADLAVAMEQHQRVVAALLELPESTRAAILLRYLEDLPPREIAARGGEPVETVRTRIKRGLAALRARLDEDAGGRRAWLAALAPLTLTESAPPVPLGTTAAKAATGALAMTIQTKLVLAVVLVLAVGLTWQVSTRRASAGSGPLAPGSPSLVDATPPERSSTPAVRAEPEAHRASVAAVSGEEAPAEPPVSAPTPPRSVLRVVDARTGAELDGLTVLRGLSRPRGAIHPGWTGDPGAVFARDAASPVVLSAEEDMESWWVHSPGYTWGWARFDHHTGGEREVALEPGGAILEVRMEGFDPALNLWLHVFPAGWERSHGSLVHVRHPDRASLRFEGLPPGPVQVRAELGIWHDGPRELARAELELLNGAPNQVVLDLERNGVLPAGAPLAGRVVLPASHPDLDFSFEIMPAEGAALRKADRVYRGAVDLERVAGSSRIRRFDAGNVTPGDYLFVSSTLQCWQAFEVGPGGAPDVEIVLPEVGEVRVRVVDDLTDEVLSLDRITWYGGRPEGRTSWTLASVAPEPHPDTGTEEYAFLAPLGRISLDVDWDEYAEVGRRVEVVPGSQFHEVRVERLPGAWLRLADGDATVPFEWRWSVDVTPVDGAPDSKARITRIEGGRAWVTATQPGTYVVEIPPLAGFRPSLPWTLDLGPGAAEEHVLRLER